MSTSKDVANLAGTSVATVSYVFNNGPRPVSEQTRAKILEAAEKLGYKPNASARALITGKTSTFGLVVPSILNPFFGELSHAIEVAAREQNHLLLIADSDMDPDQEARDLDAFINRRVDGVILVSCDVSRSKVDLLNANAVPYVALHPMPGHPDARTVHMNYVDAARELSTHLLEVHNVSTMLVVLAAGEAGSSQHEDGIRQAFAGNKAFHPTILRTEVSRADVYDKILDYLSANQLPDAIYCATDEQAYGVIAGLDSLGLRAPDDVKIVGFDGTIHSRFSTPSLTSYRQPLEDIAARSVGLLLGKRTPESSDSQLEGELVIRKSCGC